MVLSCKAFVCHELVLMLALVFGVWCLVFGVWCLVLAFKLKEGRGWGGVCDNPAHLVTNWHSQEKKQFTTDADEKFVSHFPSTKFVNWFLVRPI